MLSDLVSGAFSRCCWMAHMSRLMGMQNPPLHCWLKKKKEIKKKNAGLDWWMCGGVGRYWGCFICWAQFYSLRPPAASRKFVTTSAISELLTTNESWRDCHNVWNPNEPFKVIAAPMKRTKNKQQTGITGYLNSWAHNNMDPIKLIRVEFFKF